MNQAMIRVATQLAVPSAEFGADAARCTSVVVGVSLGLLVLISAGAAA